MTNTIPEGTVPVQGAAGHATYPGDVRHIVGERKGPNLFGEVLVAETAEYDDQTDQTRVGFGYAREWGARS